MSKFVRVKYTNRFTQVDGNYLWLNIDNIISVDETSRFVKCVGQDTNCFVVNEESMLNLLVAIDARR